MRKKLGVLCLLAGACCLLCALGFVIYNHLDANRAENASKDLLREMQGKITIPAFTESDQEAVPQTTTATMPEGGSVESVQTSIVAQSEVVNTVFTETTEMEPIAADEPQEIRTIQVNGYECIGVLSIPVPELELPVLADWSYEKLKLAPCHYYGTYGEANFVIAAHNYQAHFGRLSALQPQNLILFTDITGVVRYYEVVLLETLPADATEEMITSGFDLSLYTCTVGGRNRVTVRCNAVNDR